MTLRSPSLIVLVLDARSLFELFNFNSFRRYFFVDYINYGCFMQKSLYTERKLEGVVVNKVLIIYLRQILGRDCGNLLPILGNRYRMFAQEK